MAGYGDLTVYVEDKAGDVGGPGSSPWWLSPDVDIVGHSGEAYQGQNTIQIRVHANDEPVIDEKIVAEVYVGQPGLVLSPTTGTKRIDGGNLLFRTQNIPGAEPVTNVAGATLTLTWTPASSTADVDGPGHRCLLLRAFPQNVTPPTTPFDVPNEQHEAQHNIEVLKTAMDRAKMAAGGAGTRDDPRKRDVATGLWWEQLMTIAPGEGGKRFIAVAFDPRPGDEVVGGIDIGYGSFSADPPQKVTFEAVDGNGEQVDPTDLLRAELEGMGTGLFERSRLLAAGTMDLTPEKQSRLLLRFDHSNIEPGSAAVLHVAQWNGSHRKPEGGITIVALAPT